MQFGVSAGMVLAAGSSEKGKSAKQGGAPPASGQEKHIPGSY